MKRRIVFVVCACACVCLSGCNVIRGVGRAGAELFNGIATEAEAWQNSNIYSQHANK